MKLTTLSLLALSAATINGRFVEQHETNQVALNLVDEEKYLIELKPGQQQWVTEEEKWELRRVRLPSKLNTFC
jgi:leucyl aminopeptidase